LRKLLCYALEFSRLVYCREDPDKPHAFYDLTKDADALMESREYDKSMCFSKVRTWVHNREDDDGDDD
jgi:hypothetical protein